MSIDAVLYEIFKPANQDVQRYTSELHVKQRKLTGSGSFHFKGNVFIGTAGQPINKLHPTLHEQHKDIVEIQDRYTNQRIRIKQLINMALNNTHKPVNALYLIFPSSAHSTLSMYNPPTNHELIELVNHSYDNEIASILREHTMKAIL